jgi:hypothetical protein
VRGRRPRRPGGGLSCLPVVICVPAIMKSKQKPVCVLCRGRKLKFPLSKKMWWGNLSCGKLPCCKDHFAFWPQHLELCSELVDK